MTTFYRLRDEILVNASTAGNQTAPALAAFTNVHSPSQGFVAVWESLDAAPDGSESTIKAQLFDSAGGKLGPELLVNNQSAGSQSAPAVATIGGGRFIVIWVSDDADQNGSGSAIKARLFENDGEPVGREFLVDASVAISQSGPIVAALADGGFVIGWDDWNSFDTKAQIYNRFGAAVGGEFQLNTITAGAQEHVEITGLAGGGFVATWRTTYSGGDGSDQAVKAQMFDAAGRRIGNEFLVNSEAAGVQSALSITALSKGGFVVAWSTTDSSQDGSSGAIKAQVFSASGTRLRNELLVNRDAADLQHEPAVTALPDGGFMVVWTSWDSKQDGSSAAIKAQSFGASGNRVGPEMLVNSLAAGAQFMPDIATLLDGKVVLAWSSESGDEVGLGVRAQLLDPNRPPRITSDGEWDEVYIQLPENRSDVTTVTAIDPFGGNPIHYSIGGEGWAAFAIDSTSGVLTFRSPPDFENPRDSNKDNVYEVVVIAGDGDLSDRQLIFVRVGNINDQAPTFEHKAGEAAILSVFEGDTYPFGLGATDRDGDAIVFTLSGEDAASFTIDASTGEIQFASPANFEAPASAAGTNDYALVVTASDGLFSDTVNLLVRIEDLDEPVEITSGGGDTGTYVVPENQIEVGTVTAVDGDGRAPFFSITGGADAARFGIDAASGVLRFQAITDFETAGDANGDNVFDVVVTASDGTSFDEQRLAIVVADVDEAVTITSNGGGATATVLLAENQAFVTTVTGFDPEGGSLTYTISGGVDAALFMIDAEGGALRFVAAPNYEAPRDAGRDNVYDVIVRASDGTTSDTQALKVTVSNVSEGNIIFGNSGANTITTSMSVHGQPRATHRGDLIFGLGGDDTILSGGGDDMVDGGSGGDRIAGGLGADRLTGGSGDDLFVYRAIGDSVAGAADVITDFRRSEGDRISLSEIDANSLAHGNQLFCFIGSRGFDGVPGQLRYEQAGGQTFVYGDVDGDTRLDFVLQLNGSVPLIAADFIL